MVFVIIQTSSSLLCQLTCYSVITLAHVHCPANLSAIINNIHNCISVCIAYVYFYFVCSISIDCFTIFWFIYPVALVTAILNKRISLYSPLLIRKYAHYALRYYITVQIYVERHRKLSVAVGLLLRLLHRTTACAGRRCCCCC